MSRRSSSLCCQMEQQRALGRSAVFLDIHPEPGASPFQGVRLHAGPGTVFISRLSGPPTSEALTPWHLFCSQELERALQALHAQLLEVAHDLPALLDRAERADPEAAPARTVQNRLQQLLALRSLLELAAAWEDASAKDGAPVGWRGGAGTPVGGVLPWYRFQPRLPRHSGWHLDQLRRWHQPHPPSARWSEMTARHLTCSALLQDADLGSITSRVDLPLPPDPAGRARVREQRHQYLASSASARARTTITPPIPDLDPSAFARRVRLVLSALLEPALLSFAEDEQLRAVSGTTSGTAALLRLLPGVARGPALAFAKQQRSALSWGHLDSGSGAALLRAAGPERVRRSSWAVAWAGGVSPTACLRAEAAAGPLHLLIPGLEHAGPAGAPLFRRFQHHHLLPRTLEEVTDLYGALCALAGEQELPLPDLSPLLTGRGLLRLGRHADQAGQQATLLSSPQNVGAWSSGRRPDEDADAWARRVHLESLTTVPGLLQATQALGVLQEQRQRERLQVRAEVCASLAISELAFDEATSGEAAFELGPEALGLERSVSWASGPQQPGIWHLRLARHPQELVSDGQRLRHCVGWGGYAQAMRAGQSLIARVLEEDPDDASLRPVLTLELRPTAAGDRAGRAWVIHQARGAHNRLPTAHEARLLASWARVVGVSPGPEIAASPAAGHLPLNWRGPLEDEGSTTDVPTPDRTVMAFGAAMTARWTPQATRIHREGLRRLSLLMDRARQHLLTELTRLHAAGDPLMVGVLNGDDVLPGVGLLQLPADTRPLLQAAPQGLLIERRAHAHLDTLLRVQEARETLLVQTGGQAGLLLTFSRTQQRAVHSSFSPGALLDTGLLADGPDWPGAMPLRGAAARRWPALTLLRAVLDEPLGPLEAAATAATGQRGETLRLQLGAFVLTPERDAGMTRRPGRHPRRVYCR